MTCKNPNQRLWQQRSIIIIWQGPLPCSPPQNAKMQRPGRDAPLAGPRMDRWSCSARYGRAIVRLSALITRGRRHYRPPLAPPSLAKRPLKSPKSLPRDIESPPKSLPKSQIPRLGRCMGFPWDGWGLHDSACLVAK